MKHLAKILTTLLFMITMNTIAQIAEFDKMVPLIDREIFFDTPEISGAQLSPDGNWVSFMKEYNGITNIWVKKFDEAFDQAKPLTDNERPIGGYFWSDDSKYILFVKDSKGDENYNIYAVDPTAEAQVDTGVPTSRNLTPMKDVRISIYMVSKKDPNIMMVGINNRDKAWHDLYKLNISTGALELLYENNNRITGWDFDWDENPRLAYRTNEAGHSEILRIDENNKFTKIYETNLKEQAYVAGWDKNNEKMYLISNKGDVNLSTLYLMDPNTLEIIELESDPLNKVDFGSMFIDDNTRDIIYTSYTYDKKKRLWRDKNWEKMFKKLQKRFKGKEIGFSSFTKDYKQMLISVGGDIFAYETYYYNSDTGDLIYQYTSRPRLKEVEKYLAPMKPITFKSSDGLEIPAYLTIPYGMLEKNLPLVVLVHGGPKGPRDYWGYNPYAQMLANRGYAVLQPNFRASGGYGKAFLNAGDKEWGRLMQDDVTWGVKYLIDKGIVNKNKVAIMGGSYGGYATLAGLTFTPDLYACGVDIVGPSNLLTLLESVPPYWEAFKKSLYEMVGDPNTEEGKKLMKERSPLFHVNNIVKPLLIVQGVNDPRVKQAESDQIVVAMRDSGKEVAYLLADDEGHGYRKPVNRMAMWASAEKFLAKHIGGRYQESMPEDVKKRLGEITQDVSKVVYEAPKPVTVDAKLPTIENDIDTPADYKYTTKIEINGQEINMTQERSIRNDGDLFIFTDNSKSKMGESSDIVYLNKDFQFVKRMIQQNGQTIILSKEGNELEVNMMDKSISHKAKGAYLSEGSGFDMVVAGLPLKENYSMSYQTYDMMTQKMQTKSLKVVGKEEGNWVVEITEADGGNAVQKLWIDPVRKLALKTESVIPAMGNAKVTTTLEK